MQGDEINKLVPKICDTLCYCIDKLQKKDDVGCLVDRVWKRNIDKNTFFVFNGLKRNIFIPDKPKLLIPSCMYYFEMEKNPICFIGQKEFAMPCSVGAKQISKLLVKLGGVIK